MSTSSPSIGSKTFSVFRADPREHREDILRLWAQNLKTIPQEKLRWMYLDNPAGTAAVWLASDSCSDEVIGSLVLFPRRIFLQNRHWRAGVAGDFSVSRRYRMLGPALALQKAAIEACRQGEFDLLYSFPNPASEPVILRAGFRALGTVTHLSKPLHVHAELEPYLKSARGARILSKPLDLAFQLLSKETYCKRPGEFSCEVLPAFDERVDELWEKVASVSPIVDDKSRGCLNWRYAGCPYVRYTIFVLTRRSNGEMLGYVVSRSESNRTRIADLLALDTGVNLECLLAEFLCWQRKQGADWVTISYFGRRALANRLRSYGFLPRKTQLKFVAYCPGDSPAWPTLLQNENWCLCEGSSDV
jgi:hypothetical protein